MFLSQVPDGAVHKEEFEDAKGVIKGVIKICKSMRRTGNTKAKRTNNGLQNTTLKTKDRTTRNHFKSVVKSGAP